MTLVSLSLLSQDGAWTWLLCTCKAQVYPVCVVICWRDHSRYHFAHRRILIHSAILWAIGIFLLIIGLILALLGALGRAVFGRRHYW